MVSIRELFDKNKLILYLLIIIGAFLVFTLYNREPQVSIKPVKETKMTETEKLVRENQNLRERLARLEPLTPVKIVTADKPSAAIETHPVLNVMAEGTMVPYEDVFKDSSWVRPDYEPYWHSNQGQCSSLPDHIHTSYHRIFITPGTPELWDETMNQCGVSELKDKINIPVYENKPEDTIVVVAIQHQISDVITLQNQVLLVGTPSRTGLQVLSINKRDLIGGISGELPALNNSQEFLFQMVTPEGYEVDYNNAVISF